MSSATVTREKPLRALAALYGVQTSYLDLAQKRRRACPESILAILRAMGAPVNGEEDASDALHERRSELASRVLEPVYVAREKGRAHIDVTIPGTHLPRRAVLRIQYENGESLEYPVAPDSLPVVRSERLNGGEYATLRLSLPAPRALGYHKLMFDCGSASGEAVLIVAPRRCYDTEASGSSKQWGTFLPLYALRTAQDWGIGDFTGLDEMVRWTRELGGDFVGTLPLLAAFLEDPCDFSPYSPVSRKFWNEVFIDVDKAPGWPQSEHARAVAGTSRHAAELLALRDSERVEYRRVMKMKRACLTELSKTATSNASFVEYMKRQPEVKRYASFRAACEQYGVPWWDWPAGPRHGLLNDFDLDPGAVAYHCYVQWLADEQLSAAAHELSGGEQDLYLDFPLGVHPAGYDTWKDREMFMRELSVGAPPDSFFTKGQKWGLPPLHPDALRHSGHRYLRESLAHNLKYARFLRIDHIMAFHRVFCVPEGAEAVDGAYVRYPANEIYAVLALESHRGRAEIIGEDLGTVPQEVRTAMERNGVKRMYVLQFAVEDDTEQPVSPPPKPALASLNTHDTPTFSGFFTGNDIEERRRLDLINAEEAASEREARDAVRKNLRTFLAAPGQPPESPEDDTRAVLRGLMEYLSKSAADIVLVNLEDVWLESSPQNVPGTTTERPNWQQKGRLSFEKFSTDGEVLGILGAVDRYRKADATT